MQLSPHFSLREFCFSSTADRLGIDNTLPLELYPHAMQTAVMLEEIRAFLTFKAGREIPIRISSGYRCPALNKAVGSSDRSDHVGAFAADWSAPAFGTPTEICRALEPECKNLGIGQLINEFPSEHGGWVHTSTREKAEPNGIITITHAGTFAGIRGA